MKNKILSIIVPVYNEERQLRQVIELLMGTSCPIDREWIFVDDSSTDKSFHILKELSNKHHFRVIQQTPNQGKGSAVIRGIKEATGDYLIIQDADFEYDPRDIPSLIEPLIRGQADVVYGSRFKKNAFQVHRTYHYFVNRLLTLISNLLSDVYLTDMETCYKVFNMDLIKSMNLSSKRFGIEVEMTAYLAKVRVRIFEMPIRYYPRSRLQGKKINWKDGVAALFHLVKFNLFVNVQKAYQNLPSQYHHFADMPHQLNGDESESRH